MIPTCKSLLEPAVPESFSPCLSECHSASVLGWEFSHWDHSQDASHLTERALHSAKGVTPWLAVDEFWVGYLVKLNKFI